MKISQEAKLLAPNAFSIGAKAVDKIYGNTYCKTWDELTRASKAGHMAICEYVLRYARERSPRVIKKRGNISTKKSVKKRAADQRKR